MFKQSALLYFLISDNTRIVRQPTRSGLADHSLVMYQHLGMRTRWECRQTLAKSNVAMEGIYVFLSVSPVQLSVSSYLFES
jgi:hypothetical protein